MGPIPVTWSKQSCFVTHRRFSSSSAFSFLISPSPFNPVTLPKHKPEPIKISQAASPLQDCHQWTTPISLTCTAAWSPQWWPSGADEHKETWPISHFVTNDLLRPKTVLPHPFPYSLTLFIYLICVFRIWVLRKMLGFSLNIVCLCFSLLFGWWENNKGKVFYFYFLFYFYDIIVLIHCWFASMVWSVQKCFTLNNPFSHCLSFLLSLSLSLSLLLGSWEIIGKV